MGRATVIPIHKPFIRLSQPEPWPRSQLILPKSLQISPRYFSSSNNEKMDWISAEELENEQKSQKHLIRKEKANVRSQEEIDHLKVNYILFGSDFMC
ncbi:hypothetical protein ACHQM5_004418 [Ranunculus cassubicifolius]